MNYSTGQSIKVGDKVVVDGMAGVVVCDFDNRKFLPGFESWDMREVELAGGGKLNAGVMVDTEEAGLVYYANAHDGIIRAEPR